MFQKKVARSMWQVTCLVHVKCSQKTWLSWTWSVKASNRSSRRQFSGDLNCRERTQNFTRSHQAWAVCKPARKRNMAWNSQLAPLKSSLAVEVFYSGWHSLRSTRAVCLVRRKMSLVYSVHHVCVIMEWSCVILWKVYAGKHYWKPNTQHLSHPASQH